MMRLIPASRAIALATGLVLTMATFARAEEASTAEAASTTVEPFHPTIYVGPSFGYANQDGDHFGWAMHIAARVFRYGAIQLEYFNVGPDPKSSGDFDGLYVGLMPILPVGSGVSLYGQVGAAFADAGQNVAGGGGLLYDLPIEFLKKNNVDLVLQTDYKYFNLNSSGEHLLTLGFLLGFHK